MKKTGLALVSLALYVGGAEQGVEGLKKGFQKFFLGYSEINNIEWAGRFCIARGLILLSMSDGSNGGRKKRRKIKEPEPNPSFILQPQLIFSFSQ